MLDSVYSYFLSMFLIMKIIYSYKQTKNRLGLHFISIVTLDILLTISNFSTTCQLSVIRVLVGCSRLSVDC